MQRDYKSYFEDILEAIRKIERYTHDITSLKDFSENELVVDGTIKNLVVIGEAVKKISDDIKRKYPEIEWKKIAGLRDILIHIYFDIDLDILWEIIKNEIPKLKTKISKIRDKK